MARSKGYKRKTRSLFSARSLSRSGLSKLLRHYKKDDRVVIDIDPRQPKGMPHRRYQGKVGVVDEVWRRAISIKIPVGKGFRKIIARIEHVKPSPM